MHQNVVVCGTRMPVMCVFVYVCARRCVRVNTMCTDTHTHIHACGSLCWSRVPCFPLLALGDFMHKPACLGDVVHQQHVWCTKGIFWCTRHVGCFNACHVVLGWYAWWRLVVVSIWCTTGTFGAPKVYCGCLVHQRYVLVLNTFGAP